MEEVLDMELAVMVENRADVGKFRGWETPIKKEQKHRRSPRARLGHQSAENNLWEPGETCHLREMGPGAYYSTETMADLGRFGTAAEAYLRAIRANSTIRTTWFPPGPRRHGPPVAVELD